jgi:AraC family transcriptional regulator
VPGNIERPPKRFQIIEGSWILHEQSSEYRWEGSSQLSIKSFFGGRAHYTVGRGHHAVGEASYLVLNEGQSYAIEIASKTPVESFCLFFAPGLAAEVEQTLAMRSERLLDCSLPSNAPPIRFYERNYAHDQTLSPRLLRLRRRHGRMEPGALLEEIHGIMERLLRVHEIVLRETERLKNVRAATRDELYRRACRARDYADANFAQPVTLAELARVACLSPNHLLRTFGQVFHKTPHQFLTERRLHEAKGLLMDGDLPVTEICLAVGFDSLGSFSTLFRNKFGVSPSEWRRTKR